MRFGNAVRSDHLATLSYMVPLMIITGHYDAIIQKIIFVLKMCSLWSALNMLETYESFDCFYNMAAKTTNLTA